MKIKTKKQMNLPQLIEWLLKSRHRNYIANSDMGNTVTLSRGGAIQFSLGTFFPEETFTVEVEEEITEDTVIPEMLTIYFNGDSRIHNNKRLNDLNTTYHIKSAYTMNDDLRLILIWRDGKLVE